MADNIKTIKIVVIIAFILAIIGAFFYVIYGFSLLWQAMAAGIITGFLLVLLLICIIAAIYLWIRILLLQRKLKGCKQQIEELKKHQEKNSDLID